MRFNQYVVREESSAVAGDILRIGGSVDRLEALNATLGSHGTITGTVLEIPKEFAHPVQYPDVFAGWVMIFGEDIVLLGRASSINQGPNDLFVYACTSEAIGGHLLNVVKPCSAHWGHGQRQRTWFYECARLASIPSMFGLESVSDDSLLDFIRERAEYNRQHNDRIREARSSGHPDNVVPAFMMGPDGGVVPIGSMMMGDLGGLFADRLARMDRRHRVVEDEPSPPRERGTQVGVDVHVG